MAAALRDRIEGLALLALLFLFTAPPYLALSTLYGVLGGGERAFRIVFIISSLLIALYLFVPWVLARRRGVSWLGYMARLLGEVSLVINKMISLFLALLPVASLYTIFNLAVGMVSIKSFAWHLKDSLMNFAIVMAITYMFFRHRERVKGFRDLVGLFLMLIYPAMIVLYLNEAVSSIYAGAMQLDTVVRMLSLSTFFIAYTSVAAITLAPKYLANTSSGDHGAGQGL